MSATPCNRRRAGTAWLLALSLLLACATLAGAAIAQAPAAGAPAAPASTAIAPPPAVARAPAAAADASEDDDAMAGEGLPGGRVPPPPTPAERIARALRKGKREQALQIADTFLADHPRDAQMRFLRSVVLGDMNRGAEAALALESLTEDFPELAEPYNNLAVIRANQGDLGSAEHYLQLAIAAQPNYLTARENLGDLYIALAAAAYAQAAALSKDNAPLLRKLGMTRDLGGKLRSAR